MPLKKMTLAALFLGLMYAHSQEVNTQKVDSEIKKVTVFITGGEEQRTATVNVKKGRNKLVFTGISTVADQRIQPGLRKF